MRSDFSLIAANGKRKYLVEAEREAFLSAANRLPPRERAFCLTLEATGGRISEVLALQKRHIDRASGEIVILCLKKREDRKSTRLNSSHSGESRMPSSA